MTDRLAQAGVLCEQLHRGQVRKGTAIPYVSHLYAVAALLMEWGAEEDVVIAGLLHDAVEDCGGEPVAEQIRKSFVDLVANIVLACSDSTTSDPEAKISWLERKRAHIAEITHMSPDAALVTAADKLHNLTTLNRDLQRDGPSTLRRFKAPDRMLWYYSEVSRALHSQPCPVSSELEAAVALFRNASRGAGA